MQQITIQIKKYFLLLVILALFILQVAPHLTKPFIGHHDWNSAVYSNIARNYLRYGLFATKLGQVRNPDFVTPDQFNYVTHYPPLLPLTMATSFQLFGISDGAARAVPFTATIIFIILIYLSAKALFDSDVGFLAALFAATTPFLLYFSLIPVHDPLVLTWTMATVYCYIRWFQTQDKKYLFGIFFTLVGGGLTNWSTYYIAPPLSLHWFIFGKKNRWQFAASLLGTCIGLFLLQLFHLYLTTGEFFPTELLTMVLDRANPQRTPTTLFGYSLIGYLKQELQLFKSYLSVPIVILSTLWLAKTLLARKPEWKTALVWSLGLFGLTPLIFFRQMSFIHDYMIIYTLPFFLISAAIMTRQLLVYIPSVWLKALGFLFLAGAIMYSTSPFTQALYKSPMNERGWRVGQLIYTLSRPGEKTLLTSTSYKEFQEVFIAYYASRDVGYAAYLPKDFATQFQFVIIPKDHAELAATDKQLLEQNYKHYEDVRFVWYNLKEKR